MIHKPKYYLVAFFFLASTDPKHPKYMHSGFGNTFICTGDDIHYNSPVFFMEKIKSENEFTHIVIQWYHEIPEHAFRKAVDHSMDMGLKTIIQEGENEA